VSYVIKVTIGRANQTGPGRMKAALLVPRVTADPAVNLARIERMAADGVASGASPSSRLAALPLRQALLRPGPLGMPRNCRSTPSA
jgi:hypothetical protein